MTFCFAWKNKNDVSIIADSLITLTTISNDSNTSFNENISNFKVKEKDSKLCSIRNSIISYAGDISGSLKEILNHYKDYSDLNINELDNFITAVESEIRPNENIEFFFAYTNYKETFLYKLIFKGTSLIKKIEINDFSYIGNSEYGGLRKILESYNIVKEKTNIPMHLERIWFLTALQHHSLFNNEAENGVGGVFKSISIINYNIKWNENIKYHFGIFIRNEFVTKKEISLISFNNCLFLKSDYIEGDFILKSRLNEIISFPPISTINFKYYIFYNFENRNISIIPVQLYNSLDKKQLFYQLQFGKNSENISEFQQIGILTNKELELS